MEANCLATQMSKCCLHGDLTSVVRMHSLNTTNLSTISGNVGYLSDRYHLTTVLLASPGTAQIRDRWKRTTTKQKRKDVGRKLLGWKTNGDLIGETCDLSRIKEVTHQRENHITLVPLCAFSQTQLVWSSSASLPTAAAAAAWHVEE